MSFTLSPVTKSFLYAKTRRGRRFFQQYGDAYGKIPELDGKYYQGWLKCLGFSIQNSIVYVESPDNPEYCVIFGSLYHDSVTRNQMEFSYIPLLWKKTSLRWDDESIESEQKLLKRLKEERFVNSEIITPYLQYPKERIAHHDGGFLGQLYVSPDKLYKWDKESFYERVEEFKSENVTSVKKNTVPDFAAQLLMVFPSSVVIGMYQNQLPLEVVALLVKKNIPVQQWGKDIYKELPVEWLEATE